MLLSLLNVLVNGAAYGMLLFLMAGGLTVTMGLMRFANLAHGSLAMFAGYVLAMLMNGQHWPFLPALLAATVAATAAGALVERTVFRRLYDAPELDQVLLTIGVVSMAVAAATYVWGVQPTTVKLPSWLDGRLQFGSFDFGVYRLFLLLVGGALTLGLMLAIDHTNFGAKIRAAVDNRRMTVSCGIDVKRLFALAFAVGSALAGFGGGLSVALVGLDPSFGIKYLVFLLMVVVAGGLGSVRGTLIASLAFGVCDVTGKYYVPDAGAFILYALTVALLLWRPSGLFGR